MIHLLILAAMEALRLPRLAGWLAGLNGDQRCRAEINKTRLPSQVLNFSMLLV